MSSLLLCIILIILKRKKKEEGINSLLKRTVEWKVFFVISYDHTYCYELRDSGKFNYWNNKQFGIQLRNSECWFFLD
jgi:hypothetical protein